MSDMTIAVKAEWIGNEGIDESLVLATPGYKKRELIVLAEVWIETDNNRSVMRVLTGRRTEDPVTGPDHYARAKDRAFRAVKKAIEEANT